MYGIDHPLIPQTTQRTIGNRRITIIEQVEMRGQESAGGCDRDGIPLREVSSEERD